MRVLITNCTRNAGLALIRALAARGFEVIGADDRRSPPGLRSRRVAADYCVLPPEGSPEFATALIELLERVRPDVVIPTRGVEAAVRARRDILQRTRALLPTQAAFDAINDKATLLEHCESLGIAAPRRFEQAEAAAWLRRRTGSSIVVKPRVDIGGGEGVQFIRDADELPEAHARITSTYGGAVVTEYIPGPVTNLHAVHVLFDDDSRLIASCVVRKLRIWPAQVGVTVAAVSTHQDELVSSLLPLFEAVGWRGPAEAELKVDDRDGRAKVLEINPRLSGAIQLPIGCGVNFPELLCRAAAGERLPAAAAATYPAGVHYVDGVRWCRAVVSELLEARSSRRAVMSSAAAELRGPRVPSVYRWSDPGPSLAKLWPEVRRRAPIGDGGAAAASHGGAGPGRHA